MSSKSLRHHFLHFPWKAFGLLLLVLYFGHWLGAAVMHDIDSASGHFPHHHPWFTAIVSSLVLSGLVFCLHTLHHRNPRPKSLRLRGLLWVLSTLTVIFAYCAATWTEHAVLDLFPFLKRLPIAFILFCLVGLAAVNRVLRNVLRSIEGPEDIILTGEPEIPPRVLYCSSLSTMPALWNFPTPGPSLSLPPGLPAMSRRNTPLPESLWRRTFRLSMVRDGHGNNFSVPSCLTGI